MIAGAHDLTQQASARCAAKYAAHARSTLDGSRARSKIQVSTRGRDAGGGDWPARQRDRLPEKTRRFGLRLRQADADIMEEIGCVHDVRAQLRSKVDSLPPCHGEPDRRAQRRAKHDGYACRRIVRAKCFDRGRRADDCAGVCARSLVSANRSGWHLSLHVSVPAPESRGNAPMPHQPFGGIITDTTASAADLGLARGERAQHHALVECAPAPPTMMQPQRDTTTPQHQRRQLRQQFGSAHFVLARTGDFNLSKR